MLLITGDTHGMRDRMEVLLDYLSGCPQSEETYLLICGDFGYLFRNSQEEQAYLDQLDEELAARRAVIAFCDGNHENFDALDSLPVSQWQGGQVHLLRSRILHLMRGQCFTLEGKTFFVLGGGASLDKAWRVAAELAIGEKTWWPQEMPSNEDYRTASDTLSAHRFTFDYIITHTAPQSMIYRMGFSPSPKEQELTGYLDWVRTEASYKHWYFGHFHLDEEVDEKHTCLLNEIRRLE